MPGYYAAKGFVKIGKTKRGQYMMKDPKGRLDRKTGEVKLVDKILNIYKASIMNSVIPSKAIVKKPVKKSVKKSVKKPSKQIKTINKPVTQIIQTRRHPLPPPKTPRFKLRARTIFTLSTIRSNEQTYHLYILFNSRSSPVLVGYITHSPN